MKIINGCRCIIGEGPIWNEYEKKLYYTNGGGNEICILDIDSGKLDLRPVTDSIAAFAFTKGNRLIVSRPDGVFMLNEDNTTEPLYDTSKIQIRNANDMKVGPDGRIYVGTQSGKRAGESDKIDGKLYSIDKSGNVRILLDGLRLSNGMEWSIDERHFYHTDSDTHTIQEYVFDKMTGNIAATGRSVAVKGVDGFTIDRKNRLLAACWGQGHVAVIDTKEFKIASYLELPAKIPASCAFAGEDMDILAVTTASYRADLSVDPNAGYTILLKPGTHGRKPYLFG